MPKGIYKRTKKHLEPLIKRNKSKEQILKVKRALTGIKHNPERISNMIKNHANVNGENNPNWRGDKVGKIGIHLWLRKNFKKKMICEFCGKIGKTPLSIDWAKLKNKSYKRKRENFIELCRSCHAKYDGKGKHLNMNISQSHPGKWE